MTEQHSNALAAVYVQTNDAADNEVLAFERRPDGQLAPLGQFATGGQGTGKPHLPSQSSIVLSDDGRQLLVVNAGSDELSLFAVHNGGLRLSDRVASGGATPTSVASAAISSTCSTTAPRTSPVSRSTAASSSSCPAPLGH